jgi:hypothetical protein
MPNKLNCGDKITRDETSQLVEFHRKYTILQTMVVWVFDLNIVGISENEDEPIKFLQAKLLGYPKVLCKFFFKYKSLKFL